jgi:hypothetical protein
MFTGLRTARKCLRQLEQLQEWAHAADKLLRKQAEEIVELRGAHAKLRGKLYGDRQHVADPDKLEHSTRDQRRAAALRAIGIVPGKPVGVASGEK